MPIGRNTELEERGGRGRRKERGEGKGDGRGKGKGMRVIHRITQQMCPL